MFQIDDLIVYNSGGVCRVTDIGPLEGIPAADQDRQYYTLRPLFDNGVIRVPVDSKVFMRPVISKEEADALIDQIPAIQADAGCGSNSPQLLSEHYRTFFASHRCEDLLTLIKTVYTKTQRASAHGKGLGRTDQHFMQRARDLLEQEFSVALGIPLADVSGYISERVAAADAAS